MDTVDTEIHQWAIERNLRKTQEAIDAGLAVGLPDPTRKCEHCCLETLDYDKADVAVVEDRHPSDRGCGVMLCARHFCKRNGLR